jgi:uncharacterized SAM-binding protein YcdF (DUF218 family)
MHAIKSVVDVWLMPLPMSLGLAALGVCLRIAGRRRAAFVLMAAGALFVFAASSAVVGRALLLPLESRYHAVLDASTLSPAPRYIVVLGSGYAPREGFPVTAALGSDALMRLTEGIRLYRQLPGAALILSGGPIMGDPPGAQGYALAAVALGVPRESLILLETPLDTGAEIRALHDRIATAPVLLVTSAAHMPRAMAHCQRVGVHAIAAQTGNAIDPVSHPWGWISLPSGSSLRKTETAFHEYLGLLALRFGIT